VELVRTCPCRTRWTLSNVEPFTLWDGDPYFRRLHIEERIGDAQSFSQRRPGMDTRCQINAQAGAAVATPVTTADGKLFLVFRLVASKRRRGDGWQ